MFHPYAMVTGVFDEPLEGYKGPNGCSILSQEFYETDLSRGFLRGYTFQIVRGFGPVTTALGGIVKQPVPWGADHRRAFDAQFDRTITVSICGEDLPEPHNRVVLDETLTDSDGIPAPKVIYTMSENSVKMMAHAVARASEVLQAAGAVKIQINPLLRPAGWHLMGTARMGTHIGNSVVDAHGRCHDVKNLFIIDGSVFVTGAAVNPTSTIQALALYIADNVQQNARQLLA
jgi:choline dehydrogenase-like flavoprotein